MTLSQSEKKQIREMKQRVGRLLLHANKLPNLSVLEKEFLNDILDRQTKDRVGNFNGRMKDAYQDLYLCAGILNWHCNFNALRQICNPDPVTFKN